MNSNSKWMMIIIALAFHSGCSGQSSTKKAKTYNAIVLSFDKVPRYRGAMLEVGDSSITILKKGVQLSIPSSSIMSIKFRRKAAVGRGAAIGGAIGLSLGLIYASVDDFFDGELVAIAGVGLAMSAPGTIIGVIVGASSSKQKIKINGDQETFRSNQNELKKYVQTSP